MKKLDKYKFLRAGQPTKKEAARRDKIMAWIIIDRGNGDWSDTSGGFRD